MTNDEKLMQQALDALQEYVGVVVSVNDPNEWGPKVADGGKPARDAIEALRARLAQPEPEPVAIVDYNERGNIRWLFGKQTPDQTPLYTSPPQREWQGLTDEEVGMLAVFDGLHHVEVPLLAKFIRAIEAKLKEKNS